MRNVLIVATTSYAGMGPYVISIVNQFNLEDKVFFFFVDYEDNYFKNNVRFDLLSNATFFCSPNSKKNKIIDLLPLNKPYHSDILKICTVKKISVVHFINTPCPILLYKALQKIGVKIVSTIHDLLPHESKKEWYKEFRARIRSRQILRSINYGQNFITNSLAQLENFKIKYPGKNVFYHSFPSLLTENILSGHDCPPEIINEKNYILFFGRIEEYKGIKLLYDVFVSTNELYSNFKLIIAGSGSLPFSRIKTEKNVIFINRYIRDEEIASLYENATCVVFPYISATQSGVLSLAFYYRIPTIASDVSFFKSCISPTNAGVLFRNGDFNDLREKLLTVVFSKDDELKEKEYQYYQDNYRGDSIKRKLLDIYQSI